MSRLSLLTLSIFLITSTQTNAQSLKEEYECLIGNIQYNLKEIIRDSAALKKRKAYNERRKRWDDLGRSMRYVIQAGIVPDEPMAIPVVYQYDVEILKKKYGISFEDFVYVDHHIEDVPLFGEPGGVIVSEFHYTKDIWKWK